MTNEITNADDIIDSRDLIERIEELQTVLMDTEAEKCDRDEAQEQLTVLEPFAEEFENCAPDYQYGEAAIRETYFQEYAQELAEDIGAVNAEASWPNNCIDWEQAARELAMDYTTITFDGVDYYVR